METRKILRAYITLAFLLTAACDSSEQLEFDADPFGWPECADGQVVFGDECVDPGGLTPCELVELRGGCPEGFYCADGRGCVMGVPCGEVVCFPGERCDADQCVCEGDAPCPADHVCAPILEAGDSIVSRCVPPTWDGDGDGAPVGDIDGDGYPDDCDDLNADVAPGTEEVCDSIDNDCDGQLDEGFDGDGDGYTTCGYFASNADEDPECLTEDPPCIIEPIYGPDCDDTDPAVNPGAIDLCRADEDGVLIDSDCNPDEDSCPFGTRCCEGVDGCVHLEYDTENCGSCGNACAELFYCVVGVCRDTVGDFDVDPDEGRVTLPPLEEGPANHPEVAWNWMRVNQWFSWNEEHHDDWYTFWWELTFWELDYGVAWVQQTPVGDGVLLFNGRHFLSSPINAISQVAGDVSSFLDSRRDITWYGTTLIDVLDGEDTIPCLAPSGGLGYGVAWSDGGAGSAQVYFASLGPYGVPNGWAEQVTHLGGDHLYPRLAWSPFYYYMGSGYGMVYQQEDDGDIQIYFQQVQSFWDWWTPFGIAWRVSNNEGGALTPDVAWSPYGFGVVYVGAEDANLYFTLVAAFGGTLVPPIQLTDEGNVAAWRPSIAWNMADGEFGVAFQATSPPEDNQDIYFLRTSVYGTVLSPISQLTSDPEFQRHPDMTWASDGYGVTWYDRRSGNDEIAFAFIHPDGTLADGPEMLTEHGASGGGFNPAITYASAADEVGGVTYGLAGWMGGDLLGDGEFAMVWADEEAEGLEASVEFLRLSRSDLE